MSKYLVTGGCGFIGSHLADALVAAGHGVRILDDFSTGKRENAPSAAEIITGDVADTETVRLAMAGMDGCFHLAAIASVVRSN
ncbi:MAG: NAD-dependent epimerase/dehydratase family protein, partial [Rhodospirillaceae bacterium]|nr:NAD-dependent epimerase/dehydratase family protein [Rhodospirillaceae bacterium]